MPNVFIDRPATVGAIDALKAAPDLTGLTAVVRQLTPAQWQYAVKRLRTLGLLMTNPTNPTPNPSPKGEGNASLSFGEGSGERFLDRARAYLDQAMDGLRAAGAQEFIVRGLLARATYFRLKGEFANAWRDLREAEEIATRGEMGLHLADYHLEAARVCLAEARPADAHPHLTAAQQLIDQTGYGRRAPELAALMETM